jgi:hypothetical protein
MSATQKTEFALTSVKQSKDDDINLNQSIFKAYLETLKEKSDEATKKTLQQLQNAPISAVGRLFGDLQVNSVEQVSKIFDDLRIKPNDEIGSILENMRSKVTEQVQKNNGVSKDDITEKAKESEEQENYLTKFIRTSTDKLSRKNDELYKKSEDLTASAANLKEALRRDEATGERSREETDRAADDFVSRYNTFADTVRASQNSTVSGKAKFIDEMLEAYSSRLEKVGISKGDDGHLELDTKKLNEASDRDIEKAFEKDDSFADFIDAQAKQLSAYAQTDHYQNASAYTDAGTITQVANISGSYYNMLG